MPPFLSDSTKIRCRRAGRWRLFRQQQGSMRLLLNDRHRKFPLPRRLLAVISVADPVKPEAAGVIAALQVGDHLRAVTFWDSLLHEETNSQRAVQTWREESMRQRQERGNEACRLRAATQHWQIQARPPCSSPRKGRGQAPSRQRPADPEQWCSVLRLLIGILSALPHQASGRACHMLTGDNWTTARIIAARLGICSVTAEVC